MGPAALLVLGGLGALGAAALALRLIDPAWIVGGGICLSVLSGNWDHLGSPIGLDRLVILGGLALVLLRALRERRLPLRADLAGALLLVLALYAIGSALWVGTARQTEDVYSLLDKLGVVPFALFLLAPATFGTPHRRRILLGLLLALGAYLGWTAVLETVGLDALVLPRYIVDPTLGIHAERARGPFLEAAPNGEALFTSAVVAALALRTWRSPWVRVVAVAVIAACLVGIVGTLTRQVWVAAAVALAVTMVVTPGLRRWVPVAAAATALGVGGLFVALPSLHENAEQRADSERPVWDRLNSNGAALRMLEARPLTGFGWGTFPTESTDYYRQSERYPLTTVGRVHNMVLSNGAELGLVGLALWLGALACALAGAFAGSAPPDVERWRVGLIAVACSWAVVIQLAPFGYAFTSYLLWTWLGVVHGNVVPRRVAGWLEGRRAAAVPVTGIAA